MGPNPNAVYPNEAIKQVVYIKNVITRPNIIVGEYSYYDDIVFVKRKCEQKGPKKVSTFSTRFHVVSNVFPKYQMLTF